MTFVLAILLVAVLTAWAAREVRLRRQLREAHAFADRLLDVTEQNGRELRRLDCVDDLQHPTAPLRSAAARRRGTPMRSTRLALALAAFIGLAASTGLAAEHHPADAPAVEPPASTMPTITLPDGRTADVAWAPNPGPQTRFLSQGAYEGLYGGAAGGGKSDALLMGALRFAHHPNYQGILLRRTLPELKKTLIERSRTLYPAASQGLARYNETDKVWRFPSGARIYFGYLDTEADKLQYQGAEFQYVGFDELTHFTQSQYEYLLSRTRSSAGIPVRVRAATNPGGPGHEWVMKRWAPWLDRSPEYLEEVARGDAQLAEPGQVLHYVNGADGERWVPKGTLDEHGLPALSRVFVPARLADNPKLVENDPAYASRLNGLDPVTRAQLRDGNWLIRPAKGLFFKRTKFEIVDVAPADAQRIRYWDRAATEEGAAEDPDWTVGLKLSRTREGLFFVEDVARERLRPMGVEKLVKQAAELDGRAVAVGIEQDPGQAGKFEAEHYVRLLAGWNVRTYPVTKDKVTRAKPASAQADAGNIRLVRGKWNAAFLQELEEFPEGTHDDQVDALSGAFAALTGGPQVPTSRADLPKLNSQARSI